ncbi:helix-turn-helix domain-containing protein [Streptomyces hydrogenans]
MSQPIKPPKRKSPLVPGPERTRIAAELREQYERGGVSIRSLAQARGRSYTFVYQLLTEAGTRFRPRGNR